MENPSDSLIKRREIHFNPLHQDPDQVASAASLLAELPGIQHAAPRSVTTLHIEYDLSCISLEEIMAQLQQCGYHLNNHLLQKIKRSLYRYTEDTQRANLGCANGEPNCTRNIFVTCYRRHKHGCKDVRPEHWRRYL